MKGRLRDVIGSQHYHPAGSNWSGVYMLVGSIQLTYSTWQGFQYLPNSSKDMAQDIIYSTWGGTKGSWLCLTAKVLLFRLAWLLCFLHFLTWLNLFLGGTWGRPKRLKFFYRQEAGRRHGGAGGGGCLSWEGPIGLHYLVGYIICDAL